METEVDTKELWKLAIKEAYTMLCRSKDPLWAEADDGTRKALVRLIAENSMISQGYVPTTWRFKGRCKTCGEVPLEAPVAEELVGCPWCASQSKPSVFTFV